ncbi:MAG: NADH-quinone oxidoreductase subunit I [Elusimicrobiales bacterium]|nr:NADH-quinone oxidoreductase subunit I [Elusimicrobiales bacterium]HOJ85753.1 NADH-quinone oxidoreductase subunit I [Elusimicrobiales bacterium]HOL63321.1 NADH-quinone oxidoreductase subunit I [Elusimicrobiales bacterium]HPO95061.1 NADH-quinone oxidoreductase subunit I [Elusimicrobiales bacterium]
MIRTKKIESKPLNFFEKIYIIEVIRGFSVTLKHFFINLFFPSKIPTISYPEEKVLLPGNAKLKSRHRIKLRSDGTPKCVACMMCSTICPADCIHIEAAETETPVEKYPKVFNIDISKCVMCGLCVEACPEDAISMDTNEIAGGAYSRFSNFQKDGLFLTKNELFIKLKDEKISKLGAANRLENEYGERND